MQARSSPAFIIFAITFLTFFSFFFLITFLPPFSVGVRLIVQLNNHSQLPIFLFGSTFCISVSPLICVWFSRWMVTSWIQILKSLVKYLGVEQRRKCSSCYWTSNTPWRDFPSAPQRSQNSANASRRQSSSQLQHCSVWSSRVQSRWPCQKL